MWYFAHQVSLRSVLFMAIIVVGFLWSTRNYRGPFFLFTNAKWMNEWMKRYSYQVDKTTLMVEFTCRLVTFNLLLTLYVWAVKTVQLNYNHCLRLHYSKLNFSMVIILYITCSHIIFGKRIIKVTFKWFYKSRNPQSTWRDDVLTLQVAKWAYNLLWNISLE